MQFSYVLFLLKEKEHKSSRANDMQHPARAGLIRHDLAIVVLLLQQLRLDVV
jgi:hypothetical protein